MCLWEGSVGAENCGSASINLGPQSLCANSAVPTVIDLCLNAALWCKNVCFSKWSDFNGSRVARWLQCDNQMPKARVPWNVHDDLFLEMLFIFCYSDVFGWRNGNDNILLVASFGWQLQHDETIMTSGPLLQPCS